MDSITKIQQYLAQYARDRDWEKFHTPKNLTMALSVECSELMEHFLWHDEQNPAPITSEKHQAISHEIVDVLLYTLRLAAVMDIDLENAIPEKMRINEQRYPIDKVKGSSKKYSEYE